MSAGMRDKLLAQMGTLELVVVNAVQMLTDAQREELLQSLLQSEVTLSTQAMSDHALTYENRIAEWIKNGANPHELWEPLPD